MPKRPVISSVQLLLMGVGSALVFPFTFLPIVTSPPANQDVWIAFLLSFVYILIINAPMVFLMNRFRGYNINQTVEMILGTVLGKIASFLYFLFFLYCFSACMLITAMFVDIFLFPETPIWVIFLYMIFPVGYAAYKGAGVIARLAGFIVPLALLAVVLFLLAGLGMMDLSILLPVLSDSTFVELNLGAFFTAARYSEILIFFVFSYYLHQKASITKTYFSALLTFGLSFLAILIPTITVLGVEFAQHSWNPYYVFTRQVELLHSIERLQAVNMVSWFPMALLKLIIYCYMASYTFSGILGAKSYKPFVIPFCIVAFAVGILPFMNKSSTVEMLRSDRVFPWVILPVIFVIPVVMLIVYLARRRKIDPLLPGHTPGPMEK